MIKPMLLHHADEGFVLNDDWVLELKFDGVRAILDTTGKSPLLYTRKGVDITEQFPEVNAESGLILDGEIVGVNEKGFHKLNWVQRRLGVKGKNKVLERMWKFPIQFVAFDILNDLSLDYSNRRQLLDHHAESEMWTKSPVYLPSEHEALWKYVETNNMEGLVAKKITSLYLPGQRTFSWRKIKHHPPKYKE